MELDLAELDKTDWFGKVGLKAIAEQEQAIYQKSLWRKRRPEEAKELRELEHARQELLALGRARVWADKQGEIRPLEVVKRQADELVNAGLSLRCLNEEDLLMIHKRWPDWKPGL